MNHNPGSSQPCCAVSTCQQQRCQGVPLHQQAALLLLLLVHWGTGPAAGVLCRGLGRAGSL
jgi:hypothetical protein